MLAQRSRLMTLLIGHGTPSEVTLESYISSLSPSFWYQADYGDIAAQADGAALAAWDDQSANSLDTAQATADAKPSYQTNELNTRAIVRFDGGDSLSRASVAGSILSTNQGSTILVLNDSGANGVYGECRSAADNMIKFQNANGVLIFDHGNVTNGEGRVKAAEPEGWSGAWHVLEFHRNGGTPDIVVDGTSLALASGADSFTDDLDNTATFAITIGDGVSSVNYTGDMYLFAHFKTVLTTQQLSTLRQLLEARTGINCSPFDLGMTSPGMVQIFQRSGVTGSIVISGTVDA